MKKLICLMGMTVLTISGCGMNAQSNCENECTCTVRRDVTIKYGGSIISVTPNIKEVKRGRNFRVRLKPESDEYKDKDVQIRAEDEREAWLTGNGNVKARGTDTFLICVPGQDPRVRVGAVFPYSVSVQDVGLLDPRVKVID